AEWRAFPVKEGSSFPLTLRGTVLAESHCDQMEGFRTNAPTQSYPPRTHPRPKTAVAISGPGTAVPVERLMPPYDATAQRVSKVIVALTQSFEAERVEAAPNSALANYTSEVRRRVPVHITTLARRTR